GLLVYSTCAISPEENEEVTDSALKELEDIEALDIPLKFPFLKPALAGWEGKAFHRWVARARRIYPSPIMEGFFACFMGKR
ncbi:MAG: RsmB/NOP family class I SAM-dependent RNA methyltransferase, partial [Deltaproteobacteria bacterium]|nr:RsmB/NOP family class I SAM-dependent RNA methyltransferase [Deltaproteobacteria bacterium]